MALTRLYAGLMFLAAAFLAQRASAASSMPSREQASWLKPLLQKTWTGDLDGMTERRVVRALVVHSKTYYFVDKGTQRGISYDYLRLFEDQLNAQLKKQKKRPVIMVFVPVPRDQLIPALMAGRGDIAAAGITITPAAARSPGPFANRVRGSRRLSMASSSATAAATRRAPKFCGST
jgi:ABC-type amino acid transport substrate-binding protein